MKEKIIKFIVIALVAFFSVSMACADTVEKVRYPYVERVEVGYKIKPFELSDTICYGETNKAYEKEKEEEEEQFKLNFVEGLAVTFFLYMFTIFVVMAILGTISFIILLVAKLQSNIAKKR